MQFETWGWVRLGRSYVGVDNSTGKFLVVAILHILTYSFAIILHLEKTVEVFSHIFVNTNLSNWVEREEG
jgi:hypothetical protein